MSTDEPIVVFYHICAIQHCLAVMEEQMAAILYSGLYAHPSLVRINCFITANSECHLNFIKQRLLHYGHKIHIMGESLNTQTYERFTLEKIKPILSREDTTQDTRVLYIHTKGVSQTEPDKITNTSYWTRALNYHLIGRHRECLAALRQNEVVGAFYSATPAPHFQGNFWWTRKSYVMKLPDHSGAGYLEPELNFLFRGAPRWFSMATVPSTIKDLYKEPLFPLYYTDDGGTNDATASCK